MTTADTEARTALQELLEERQRYQGWLRALEQRRASTPAHVYERVHTDYTLRLERVMQRLRERAEQLGATIEGMQSRLQALRSREADRTDERHEFELRAAVGELSPEEWERRRTDADRELSSIAEDRNRIEAELAELERIVAMTRETPREEPAAPEAAVPTASAAAEPEGHEPGSAEPARDAPQAPAPTGRDSEQEPRGVRPAGWGPPVVPASGTRSDAAADASSGSRASSAADRPRVEGAPSTAGERPLAAGEASDSPSIEDFVAEWPLRQMGGAAGGAPADVARSGAADVRLGGETPSNTPASATWHPPVSAPASAREGQGNVPDTPADVHEHHVGDGRRDVDKTLKCPECGAMNYATEWYCERCGGELASF